MNWHWKELLPVDRFSVRVTGKMVALDEQVLTLLYQPLIGFGAHSLYLTLAAQLERDQYWSSEQSHHQLMLQLGSSLANIYEQRKKLEGIGLLKTFKRKEDSHSAYLYELQAPMSPQEFFENDVLSVYLLNQLGKNHYRRLRERFTIDRVDTEDYAELTYAFDEVFTSLHHSEIVSNLHSETAQGLKLGEGTELIQRQESELVFAEESFDFDLMKNDVSSFVVPEKVLTPAIKERIVQLAFVYRIEPLEMSRIIEQTVIHEDEIDERELRRKVQEWYKLEVDSTPPASGSALNRRSIGQWMDGKQ